MRDGHRRGSVNRTGPTRGARPALAVLTAAAVLTGLAGVTGCDEHSDEGGPPAARRPSPSARPTPEWDTSPESIAALGDSISRGFDACAVLADCPEVSWSTGTDPRVRSLSQRLLKSPAGRSWNYARTGARMADLPGQVATAVRRRPELVTVTLGANDACRDSTTLMTPAETFRADFRTALKRLRRSLPRTQVYVSSVPDLKRLWSEGRRNPFGKQVWRLGMCASMLSKPDAMDRASMTRRQQVYDRVVAYNTALRDVCGKDPLCRYDDGAVFGYLFTGEQLSKWDWFHPSRNGQQRLAEMAYRRITADQPVA
ncbi:SGNH/GDSL hydrolase family protein [Streptomyces sp. NPDC004647]|uniref:SGNH/GDSL hydrolase family protein n=1 Tax=Streptomyces sp. NPDC004647 TaxID=3154671 RepID=UPI0033A8D323